MIAMNSLYEERIKKEERFRVDRGGRGECDWKNEGGAADINYLIWSPL